MAAAAKISSYLTYIYDFLGTQAYFVLLRSSLIQENSNQMCIRDRLSFMLGWRLLHPIFA